MSHPTTEHDGSRPSLRRRRYIVDPAFQWNMIWRISAQSALTLLLVSLFMFGPVLWDLLADDPGPASADTAVVMLYMHARWWWIAAISLLFAALSALRMSHRIAGPLVRFNRNLRWLGEGRFAEPLRTRPGDYLKPEVEILNTAIAGLAQRIANLRTAHDEAVSSLLQVERDLEGVGDRQAAAALGTASNAMHRLGEQLDQFGAAPQSDAVTGDPAAQPAIPATDPA